VKKELNYAPYSYSKISTYKNCPYRFKLQYIDKIRKPFEKTEALEKGHFLHYGIENYLKGSLKENIKTYKFTIKQFEDYIDILKQVLGTDYIQNLKNKNNLSIEEGFGIKFNDEDNDYILQKYNRKADIYGYIDLMYFNEEENVIYIIDHKSGKFRTEQDKLQVYIYYLVALKKYKLNENTKIKVEFFFMEHNKVINEILTIDDKDRIIEYIKNIIFKIEEETKYAKKDTFCQWCPYYLEECNGQEEYIDYTKTFQLGI